VQELGREVGSVGPGECLELGVNLKLTEEGWITERFENRAEQLLLEINFTGRPIAEPQPDDIFADVPCLEHIVIHRLLQRCDLFERLALARPLPVLQ
jgi:hypothetical protein